MSIPDIHTHHDSPSNAWTIRSFQPLEQILFEQHNGACAIGMHPWFFDTQNAEAQWTWVEQHARLDKVKAIGECGFDALRGPFMDFQATIWLRHLHLAEALQKPLIIHCVRAHDVFLKILKDEKPSVPIVLHGWNKKATLLQPFLDLGVCVSFGAALIDQAHVQESFKACAKEKVFLETDAQPHTIADIADTAADLWGVSVESCRTLLIENAKKIAWTWTAIP